MFRILACFAAATVFVGCAAQPDLKPPAGDDPANPQAPESPISSLSPRLALQPPPAEPATAGQPSGAMPEAGDMKGMDMSEMPGMGHGAAPAATRPATQPAAKQALYTCKMHPQVVSDHPGKCPICGMKLVPKAGGK